MPFASLNLHRLLHLLSSPRRSIFQVEAREDPAILRLDDRVVDRIHEHLSLVDRACLSLCCKRFFDLYGTVVKHKAFTFPRLLRIRVPLMVGNQALPRNQLLLRLENRRWACCWGCLKLHPRTEFPWISHLHRPLDRSCAAYAGIVDLCPCISLTLRGRERLINFLKSSPKPETKYGHFLYTFTRSGRPCLTHLCTYRYLDTHCDMDVWVSLSIDGAGQLETATQYTLQFPSPHTYIKADPVFVCPHQDLLSQKNWDWNYVGIDRTCVYCRTTFSTSSEGRSNPVFWAVRNLGLCKWGGDITWYNQCRLPGTPMALDSMYQ